MQPGGHVETILIKDRAFSLMIRKQITNLTGYDHLLDGRVRDRKSPFAMRLIVRSNMAELEYREPSAIYFLSLWSSSLSRLRTLQRERR